MYTPPIMLSSGSPDNLYHELTKCFPDKCLTKLKQFGFDLNCVYRKRFPAYSSCD